MSDDRRDRDEDLPLHDEAAAREKWRGDETIVAKGEQDGLPASEVDHAAAGGEGGTSDAAPIPRADLRPPD